MKRLGRCQGGTGRLLQMPRVLQRVPQDLRTRRSMKMMRVLNGLLLLAGPWPVVGQGAPAAM